MYVTLLFDVEDLVDPRSDDVTLRQMDIFREEGAPSTWMIVGEKARLWAQRGRQDLMRALEGHDFGLHTNRHSIHPTVAEYLEGKGWDDGIAEVVARERPGAEDETRLFGRAPSCWGRGGSTWGPQVAPALRRIGIPAMVYPFTHTESPTANTHYFCDTLCYADFYGGFDATFSDDATFAATWDKAVSHVAERVSAGADWLGLFVCHPAMVRATRFWDYLNFNHGVNAPKERWRMPEFRSDAEWAVAQGNLRRLAHAVTRLPGVQVRTIRELNALVAPPTTAISSADLVARARASTGSDAIPTDDPLLSPAERLYLWALYLDSGRPEGSLPFRYVEGPVAEPPATTATAPVAAEDVKAAAAALRRAVERDGRLPSSVTMAGRPVGVGTLYRAFAQAAAGGEATLRPGPETPPIGDTLRREVTEGVPGWMHKPDLDVSAHAALTRLQSWTLKPAVLR